MALLTLDGTQAQTPTTPALNPFAPQQPKAVVSPVQQTPAGVQNTGQFDPSVVALMHGLKTAEGTNGNYNAIGDQGTAAGIGQWSNQINGVPQPLQQGQVPANFSAEAKTHGLDPNDFSPENQNKVIYARLSADKQAGLTPEQILSKWNSGDANKYQTAQAQGNGPVGVYDVADYVKRGMTAAQSYAQARKNQQSQGTQTQDPNALPDYGATFAASPDDNLFVGGLKALGNIPSSVYGLGAGLVNVAMHPIDTAKNLGSTVIGGAENLTGANQGNPDQYQQIANNFGHAIMQRYGSLDALKNTLINDPAGAALDLATLVTGGEGIAAKGADLADLAAGTGKASMAAQGVNDFAKTGLNVMPQYGQYGSAVRSSIQAMNDASLATLGKIASPVTAIPRAVINATLGGGANEEALAAAGRTGVELPAAAYTRNSLVRSAEAIAATGSGEAAYTARVDKALQGMNSLADKIVASTNGETDLQTVGTSIVKGTEALAKAHDEAISELYRGLEAKAGDVAARADTTLRTLDKILADQEKIGETNGVGYFKNKVAVLSGAKTDEARIVPIDGEGNVTEAIPKGKQYAPPTFSTLKQVRTAIGQKIKTFNDPLATTNKQQLIQLYASLSQDMRNTLLAQKGGEELAATWDKANLAFGDNMDIVSSQYAKTIRRLAKNGQEDKILSTLFKPSMSANDIPRILQLAGPEASANIRAAFTKQLLDSARDATTGDFTAGKIDKALARYGDEKIGAILEPAQIQQIKDLGTLSDAMKEIIQLKKGASTNFLVRTALSLKTLGEPAALAFAGYKLLSGDVAGGTSALLGVIGYEGLSRFLASDIGNRVLQWGAQHGSEFAKTAESQGLTPPQPLGTMDAHGIPNSNRGSIGNIGSDRESISGTTRSGSGSVANLGKSSTPSLEELAKQKNFDLNGARTHGYSDAEIQSILNPKAEGETPKSTEVKAGSTEQPPQEAPKSSSSDNNTILDKVKEVFKTPPKGFVKNPLAQKADTSGSFDGQKLSVQQQGMKDQSLRIAKERGIETTSDGNLVLYHGTKEGRAPLEGENWRVGSYFTDNPETAKSFARAGEGGKVKVMKVEVPPQAVFNSGDGSYWSSNEAFPIKSSSPSIPKELVPLAKEAQKYKTAEEFVKAKANAYHGSYTNIDKFEKGYFGDTTANNQSEVFYFTKSEHHAKEYSREAFARRNEGEYGDKMGFNDEMMKKLYEDAGLNINTNPAFVNIKKPAIKDWEGESLAGRWDEAYEFIDDAKARGKDGVIFKNISDDVNPASEAPQEVVIAFEPEQIMTKKDLTDFFNKVKGK